MEVMREVGTFAPLTLPMELKRVSLRGKKHIRQMQLSHIFLAVWAVA